MKHEKLDSIGVATIICCVILMAMIGLCIYVMVNSPIIDENKKDEISQGLSYTDYVEFVNKEEKCLN